MDLAVHGSSLIVLKSNLCSPSSREISEEKLNRKYIYDQVKHRTENLRPNDELSLLSDHCQAWRVLLYLILLEYLPRYQRSPCRLTVRVKEESSRDSAQTPLTRTLVTWPDSKHRGQ